MRDNADKKAYLRKTLRYAFIYGSSYHQRLSTVYNLKIANYFYYYTTNYLFDLIKMIVSILNSLRNIMKIIREQKAWGEK
ncbi:MAG: hypothetical protein ACJAX4_004282 [Clostridium sp.]|jgi:hypothetical protein